MDWKGHHSLMASAEAQAEMAKEDATNALARYERLIALAEEHRQIMHSLILDQLAESEGQSQTAGGVPGSSAL